MNGGLENVDVLVVWGKFILCIRGVLVLVIIRGRGGVIVWLVGVVVLWGMLIFRGVLFIWGLVSWGRGFFIFRVRGVFLIGYRFLLLFLI